MKVNLHSASTLYAKRSAPPPSMARFTRGAATTFAILALGAATFLASPHATALAYSRPVAQHKPASVTITPVTVVYLYVDGEPVLMPDDTYIPGYTSGHVYDDDDNLVGTVPDPTTGYIYDSNNNCLGYISTSV